MDKLNRLFTFVKAAEHLSFVSAGRDLGISASAVGKSIAGFEEYLGVRLFQRTTRSVNLTEEGSLFYERCRKIIDDLEDAQSMLLKTQDTPRGTLRITLPTVGYHFLLPSLPSFMQRYPEVHLDLDFTDDVVDLIENGCDAAIRGGTLPDSRFMAKRLGTFRFVICATPDYLEGRRSIKTPDDLAEHHCLFFRFPSSRKIQKWNLAGPNGQAAVSLDGRMICNNMEALLVAVLQSLGLAYMPAFLADAALRDGRLLTVLDNHLNVPGEFWIIWPSSQNLSPKLRAFIDHAAATLFRADNGA